MNTEINNLFNLINEIQKSVYNGSPITKEMNAKWANAVKRIHELGFKPRRKKMYCEVGGRIVGRVLWVASKKRPHTSQKYCAGNWVKDEHEKNHNTECTTRALYFCLNHEIPYQQIRSMQNVKALRKFGRGRLPLSTLSVGRIVRVITLSLFGRRFASHLNPLSLVSRSSGILSIG
jgi:hypothetical protein